MNISEKDLKKLWGRAAGRCSYPGCGMNCLPYLNDSDPTVVGEMAHIIARSPKGPRAIKTGGTDTYNNLILLCPNHHTLIDKAPTKTFPVKTLLKWKTDHEQSIENSLKSPLFNERKQLDRFVGERLIENRICWATYGPDSNAARKNPFSSLGLIWPFRKLALIIPNNRSIISALQSNKNLLSLQELEIASAFIEHAEGFERSSITPMEDIPRFPTNFGALFNA